MNALLSIALIFVALVSCVVLCVFLLIGWVAKGEPDVNGDPELDSGE